MSNISVAYCLDEMGQICQLDHCQVQMTSCDANPDGGEEGGTESGEAIQKFEIFQYRPKYQNMQCQNMPKYTITIGFVSSVFVLHLKY